MSPSPIEASGDGTGCHAVRVHGGTTEVGRPYFVMELVLGIKITHYCDQNQLSTKDRLDLFLKWECSAAVTDYCN
jgi:hypothetical protein